MHMKQSTQKVLYDKYGVPIPTAEQQTRLDEAAAINKKYPTRGNSGMFNATDPINTWKLGKDGQPELTPAGTSFETRTAAGRKEWYRREPSDNKNFDPDVGRERRSRIVNSRQVTQRDAVIAKSARQTLADRAQKVAEVAEKTKPKILNNPIIGAAVLLADADKATDYKRVKYTGSFGGPSFNKNPYASTNSLSTQIRAENDKRKK